MKVLLTGFDPFGGEKVNPSLEVVQAVPFSVQKHSVSWIEVPTEFRRAVDVVLKQVEKEKPDVVICVGQAGGRKEISLERVAINLSDARIPDNFGDQPLDQPIVPDGPTAYFTKLPVKAIREHLVRQSIPAVVSYSAGTYVCNCLMYGVLHAIDTKYPEMLGGFIHVPFLPEQVRGTDRPSMPKEDMIKAIVGAIEMCVEHREDITVVGGILHGVG